MAIDFLCMHNRPRKVSAINAAILTAHSETSGRIMPAFETKRLAKVNGTELGLGDHMPASPSRSLAQIASAHVFSSTSTPREQDSRADINIAFTSTTTASSLQQWHQPPL